MDFNICANCKYFLTTDSDYMFGHCIKEFADAGLDIDEIKSMIGPIGNILGDDYMCADGELND